MAKGVPGWLRIRFTPRVMLYLVLLVIIAVIVMWAGKLAGNWVTGKLDKVREKATAEVKEAGLLEV